MTHRRLSVLLAALALATGMGVSGAVADNSPAPTSDCAAQAGQHDDDQATAGAANAVSAAAADVEQEADNKQADDQAGDQHGATDDNEDGEANQCGVDEEGQHGEQDEGNGDHEGDG